MYGTPFYYLIKSSKILGCVSHQSNRIQLEMSLLELEISRIEIEIYLQISSRSATYIPKMGMVRLNSETGCHTFDDCATCDGVETRRNCEGEIW